MSRCWIVWFLLTVSLLMGGAAGAEGGEAQPEGAGRHLPDSCFVDFHGRLDAPAGKRGFLQVGKSGHFQWADGRRARFWGINVSSTRLDIPPEQIEQVADTFARAGLNLVRLEAIDNRNCLLGSVDAPDSRHLDGRYLDRLDHWMNALRRRGIYYYLDLLDFRTFKAGDGVLNADRLDRGARPYALFDRYLIALQKEYAAQLLTHRNPYSGLRPVDDPALALVEICNEHGFFLYPEKLETLVEPYRSDLRARWNDWLRRRYGTRERLAEAWGMTGVFPALRPDEDPNGQTVDLPLLTNPPTSANEANASVGDARRAANRVRDGVEFLVGVQRAYFREMRAYLRDLGLRIPVTAVVSAAVVRDVASVAQECDFTSENWYGEGVTGDARQPGLRFYSNRNALREAGVGGFAPYTAGLRWNNQPVVIREWATTWPNHWRAASVPEVLAYASLQDYDAVLLFGYQTNRAPNGAEADALNDFAFQSDPTVWGLYALAGEAFLRGDVQPARRTVTLEIAPSRQFAWPNRLTDAHRAAYVFRLNSILTKTVQKTHSVSTWRPTGDRRDLLALRGLLADGKNGKNTPLDNGIWRSDTGQISRFVRDGRLEVRTPRVQMLAGELEPGHVYDLGSLRFSTPTRVGALLALSLDGRPLAASRHFVVKMVSKAENTGQNFTRAASNSPNRWVLNTPGAAPVITGGKPSKIPTRLWLGAKSASKLGTPTFALWLENGSWELEVTDGRAVLACDTPGVKSLWKGSPPAVR